MKNFKATKNVPAHAIMEDDHIKVGGKLYRVKSNQPSLGTSDRLHISAHLVGGHQIYDLISLFLQPYHQFTIYNQNYKK